VTDPLVPGDRARSPRRRRDVVVVGAGSRAHEWCGLLQRSAYFRPVAIAGRGDATPSPGRARYATLDEAIRRHPAAAFAVAVPPRAATDAACMLAAAQCDAIVEAPLHACLLDLRLAATADRVRVAHGWNTLPGLLVVQRLIRSAGAGRIAVEVAGLPEAEDGDVDEVLVHAAALLRVLIPSVTPIGARSVDGATLALQLRSTSAGDGWQLEVRLRCRGQRINVRVEGAGEPVVWAWEEGVERIVVGQRIVRGPRATPPGAVRALAQLLPGGVRGDDLRDATAALDLVRQCRGLLPAALPIGRRPLRHSASVGRRRPADLLDRLGLRGTLPPDPQSPAAVLSVPVGDEWLERWAFRAGLKPVVFLTVRPEDVERTVAAFGGVYCERRDRRVQIGSQDQWVDRRDAGEPRVELYLSHDPVLARRAAAYQADADPTRAVRELGALLGYPHCCVDAFAAQDDRANNSRNRYWTHARSTAPDGSTSLPWPWQLNNLFAVIAPFYPCSYRCAHALAWVCATLGELERVEPAIVAALRAVLARPVLYFDHEHQLVFDGECPSPTTITYRSVAVPPFADRGLHALVTAVARGNRLTFTDEALEVTGSRGPVLQLGRTDPALGVIAPFGVARSATE
jgi:hypothetical protein